MDGIPVLAFVGYSGVGKTTLLEKLVTSLKARGLRLAVVKHDGHEFAADCAFTDRPVPPSRREGAACSSLPIRRHCHRRSHSRQPGTPLLL